MELCWLTTSKCNQQCKYCDRFLEHSTLNEETFFHILDKLISYDVRKLTFGGGESLLLDFFPGLVEKCVANNMYLKLVTNGKLIPQNEYLIPYFDEITLSVDSEDSTINEILGRGVDHFDNICSAISVLKSHKVKININTVITKFNCDSIKRMCDIVEQWEINQWRIFRFCPLRGVALSNREQFEITDEQFLDACECVRKGNLQCIVQFRNYDDMNNGYLLITPKGKLCVSRNLIDEEVGDMLSDDLTIWFN